MPQLCQVGNATALDFSLPRESPSRPGQQAQVHGVIQVEREAIAEQLENQRTICALNDEIIKKLQRIVWRLGSLELPASAPVRKPPCEWQSRSMMTVHGSKSIMGGPGRSGSARDNL